MAPLMVPVPIIKVEWSCPGFRETSPTTPDFAGQAGAVTEVAIAQRLIDGQLDPVAAGHLHFRGHRGIAATLLAVEDVGRGQNLNAVAQRRDGPPA